MTNLEFLFNEVIMHKQVFIQKFSWIFANIFGTLITWGLISEMLLSLLSTLVSGAVSFFFLRYLSKRFSDKNQETKG